MTLFIADNHKNAQWKYFSFSCYLKLTTSVRLTHFLNSAAMLLCACLVLPGVIDRWELLQAQALSKELRMKQNLQKWQQFNSDLNNIWAWLGDTERELEQLQRLELSTDIPSIELQIRKLKVAALGPSQSSQPASCPRECLAQ